MRMMKSINFKRDHEKHSCDQTVPTSPALLSVLFIEYVDILNKENVHLCIGKISPSVGAPPVMSVLCCCYDVMELKRRTEGRQEAK